MEDENINLKIQIGSFAEKFIEKETQILDKIENLNKEIENEIK